MYATFCTTSFFIELNVVVRLEDPAVSPVDSTTIFFSLLFVSILSYFICDVTFLDHWLRFIFTPYITVLIVLISIVERNWSAKWLRNYRNPAYISSVLGITIIFTLTKLLLTVARHKHEAKTKDYLDTKLLDDNTEKSC